MLKFRIFQIILLACPVLLTACSSFDLNSSNEDELVSVPPVQSREEAQVVENLVTEAGNLDDITIEQPIALISSEDAENAIHIHAEPVVPTVAMTPNRVVERTINDYLQNRRTLLRIWAERGHTYFPMIEKIFEEEGVPDELKYIALGESNLRPTARSSAGAAGMWQFMSATGRGEGLTIDTWVDERLDPEKATRAAARHLRELYDTYSGNWHLALAGYNCSYRCISRAVSRAGGSIENPPSFWEIYPYLPRETRNFIPKFITASLIISNPEMYGISSQNLGQEFTYEVVEVQGMLSIENAALLAGVDQATIRNLNPELRKTTLPDSLEPYPLKIPVGTYERFINAFANLPDDAKVAPTEYIVKSGDTLGAIARKYDISVDELQATNGIRGHLIQINQKLLIPGIGFATNIAVVSTERQSVAYGEPVFRPIKLRDEFQLVEHKSSPEDKPMVAVSLSPDIEDNLIVPTIYRVRSGDNLGQISQRFDVSISDIQKWNNIRGTTIFANQELTIHTMASTPEKAMYTVQSGDNLGAIARRFGVSVDNLKRLNGLRSNLIFPGQALVLN